LNPALDVFEVFGMKVDYPPFELICPISNFISNFYPVITLTLAFVAGWYDW
jgi:hypothetical protein